MQYDQQLRVGAAGGISTPAAAAAAFSMGAAYLVTGSVNQACVEAGTSDIVRQMLAETQQADVVMAPAADMFEMGVKVQVLKRGTMFAMRGTKLYELYRKYDCIENIPQTEQQILEQKLLSVIPWRWCGNKPNDIFQSVMPVKSDVQREIQNTKWH